jgi:hypothetical protein
LPTISICILKILIEKDSPPTTESASIAMLVMICQGGTPDVPSLNMVITGAVTGKRVSTTQTKLFGKNMFREESQSGTKLPNV